MEPIQSPTIGLPARALSVATITPTEAEQRRPPCRKLSSRLSETAHGRSWNFNLLLRGCHWHECELDISTRTARRKELQGAQHCPCAHYCCCTAVLRVGAL